MPYFTGQPIAPELIPDDLRTRIAPTAPDRARMAIARALLPMPPEKLCLALGVLARDPDAAIAEAAAKSLAEVPRHILHGVATKTLPAAVCDLFAQLLHDDIQLIRLLVANESTADSTVGWLASQLRGEVLEAVALNQRRLVREPRIISALVANPATPTPLLAPVIELALREKLDTARIPGFRELAKAFFKNVDELMGADPAQGKQPPEPPPDAATRALLAEAAAEGIQGERAPEPTPAEPPLAAAQAAVLAPNLPQQVEQQGGIEESLLELMLREGLAEPAAGAEPAEGAEGAAAETEDTKRQAIWKLIGSMNVAQKVRLALMGDKTARNLLVRDPNRTVSMAVLKCPRLTEREVSDWAANKAMSEEVIHYIARKRDWTKGYAVRLSLVKNPKCPPTTALTFLRSLRQRDLATIARGHDAPAYLRRSAKMMHAKTQGG
jgi:hypothetical protein